MELHKVLQDTAFEILVSVDIGGDGIVRKYSKGLNCAFAEYIDKVSIESN